MALAMPSVMVVDEFGFRTRIRRFRLRKRSSDMIMDPNGNLNNTKMQSYIGKVLELF
jgi:hypothetical protein